MDFHSIIAEFEEVFPEITFYGEGRTVEYAGQDGKRAVYEKIKQEGPYSYFCSIVNHYVVHLLEQTPIPAVATKLFQFLEEMAVCDDADVQNLLEVEVLEHLRDQPYTIYQIALSMMGYKTRKLEKHLDSYMGKPSPPTKGKFPTKSRKGKPRWTETEKE